MYRKISTHLSLIVGVALAASITMTSPASAQVDPTANWKTFKSDAYGFQMRVPRTAGLVGASLPKNSNWAGLYGQHLNVQLWGITQRGVKHGPNAIAAFGIQVTKIPAKHWVQIAAGKNKQGFAWYRVAVAQNAHHAVVAIYGVGAKGSYILFLKAPKWVYAKYKASFHRWAQSIRLF